jgi:hypothetical protein
MDIDENELQIVNKGNQRLNKHSFDAWHEFQGFDIKKSIANLSKDPNAIMVLVDMLVMFILQVAKKDEIISSNEV